ncbi:hypothetical protein SR882_01490 [Guyparkeria halophila]|uniref:Uncharacterized protein n=1 Tax=Guyparkeria halophila TaxID=47960 RepID=A0ABZ0YZF9_9GAMM|nr:hypothetical protein [Guyparkeria halophila]WQH16601.1 hypothetical protein SR882_01490 [Guyparkeria halophila]
MQLLHHCGEEVDQIVVTSPEGDREIARFRYADLDRFIAEGKLSIADLFDRRPAGQAALCRQLALLACAQECRHGMACLAVDCPYYPLAAHHPIPVLDSLPAAQSPRC